MWIVQKSYEWNVNAANKIGLKTRQLNNEIKNRSNEEKGTRIYSWVVQAIYCDYWLKRDS